MRTVRSRVGTAATVAILMLGGAACAGGDGDGATGGGGVEMRADSDSTEAGDQAARAALQVGDQSFAAEGPGTTGSPATRLPSVGPAVIKTARLEIEVGHDGLEEAIDDAVAVAEQAGGFVLSTRLENEATGRGSLVLRIPAENFETTLAGLDDLGKVEGRTVAGEDVTEEFVDLEARLRNFEAQEAALLRLLERARTIAGTIRVQRELTPVQLEIERIRGRLRFLDDQTSLGTVTLSLREAGAVVSRPSTIAKAWREAGAVLLGVIAALIVSLGFIVPAAVLILLALVAYRRIRPRLTSQPGA